MFKFLSKMLVNQFTSYAEAFFLLTNASSGYNYMLILEIANPEERRVPKKCITFRWFWTINPSFLV